MSEGIQLFIPKYRIDECLAEIKECLEKGWTGVGFKTIEFEKEWMKYTGLPCAHFVASATAGLHLAVRLLKEQGGWEDGDEIISTPLTFVSSNHAILYENLNVVFADVDKYLCLDPKSIESRITPKTRAVLFVGLGGNTGQLAEVVKLCKKRNLKLILDAAHMAGTRFNGRHVGYDADVTVFSFHAVKNLPTADGGMICFNEPELDKEVRKWSWLGINKDTFSRTVSQGAYKWHYEVESAGFKYHGNSIMASLGLVGLKYLDADNSYRRQLAAWYDELLAEQIERVPVAPGCESSRHLYQILVDDRDEVMLALNDCKIYPGVHYRVNTAYEMYAHAADSVPRASVASERIISLPMHMGVTRLDVERICSTLNEMSKVKPKAKKTEPVARVAT
ncbi:MAG: DegT/DnrJ/EryC1/StrS family aminotransferase [Candidatus Melainabacteria bacterium]|jgi:dTDP-4-amino-4,6-dideoxygalactose transaminase|nr:DegT/DnrJ/EryC1/StrS family aminotransferase [Candidatus Melainabacteria bacterium]